MFVQHVTCRHISHVVNLYVHAYERARNFLRPAKPAYVVNKGGEKINHLLFMDDLKLFVKNEDQIDCSVNTVRTLGDSKMGFGLPKCAVLIMKRE